MQLTYPPETHTTDTQRHATSGLVLRNYNHTTKVGLTLTITDGTGEVIVEDQHMLKPLTTVVPTLHLPAGEYQITATIDDTAATTETCTLGESVQKTAYVETGNGVVSIVDGFG